LTKEDLKKELKPKITGVSINLGKSSEAIVNFIKGIDRLDSESTRPLLSSTKVESYDLSELSTEVIPGVGKPIASIGNRLFIMYENGFLIGIGSDYCVVPYNAIDSSVNLKKKRNGSITVSLRDEIELQILSKESIASIEAFIHSARGGLTPQEIELSGFGKFIGKSFTCTYLGGHPDYLKKMSGSLTITDIGIVFGSLSKSFKMKWMDISDIAIETRDSVKSSSAALTGIGLLTGSFLYTAIGAGTLKKH
jgi:hypothetical protein